MLRPNVAILAEQFLAHKKSHWSHGTFTMAQKSLRLFADFIGDAMPTGKTVLAWSDECHKRWTSPETINWQGIKFVRQFLRWLEDTGEIDGKPISVLISQLKVVRKAPLRFTPEQYEKVKQATKGTAWHYAAICSYRTGMRFSDVSLLKWDSVDFNELVIRYLPWKTKRSGVHATCPFTAGGDLHKVLLEMQAARMPADSTSMWKDYVCPELAMKYPMIADCNKCVMTESFGRLCGKLGFGHLSFHKLRNSFISRVVNSGVSFPKTSQLTGMTDYKIFMGYAKPDVEALRQEMAKVDKADADGTNEYHPKQ